MKELGWVPGCAIKFRGMKVWPRSPGIVGQCFSVESEESKTFSLLLPLGRGFYQRDPRKIWNDSCDTSLVIIGVVQSCEYNTISCYRSPIAS